MKKYRRYAAARVSSIAFDASGRCWSILEYNNPSCSPLIEVAACRTRELARQTAKRWNAACGFPKEVA